MNPANGSDRWDQAQDPNREAQSGEQQTWLGTVMALQANYYRVRLDQGACQTLDGPVLEDWLCIRRSRLKKIGQQVMVGDRVRLEEPDWQGGRAAIVEILPRHSSLDRPPVANVSQILLVFALAEPDLDPHLLSRFLVKAESIGLPLAVGLSKCDLVSAEIHQTWRDRLQSWGYKPLLFSLQGEPGLGEVLPWLENQVTIMCGPSGVGKSSLINALIPDLDLRVGEVSGKLGKGRHTTRHVELFKLEAGGVIADSPGFNQPEIDCDPAQLGFLFPEIRGRLQGKSCQFSDCLHGGEPGCVVGQDWERYDDYWMVLQEVQTLTQQRDRSRDPEASLKRKNRGSGQVNYEPRLAQKKYRQQSRRSQQQSLQSFQSSSDWLDQDELED